MGMKHFGLAIVALGCVLCLAVAAGEKKVPKKKFKPNPKLAGLADNTLMDLGPFIWEMPKGEPHHGGPLDYSGMIYDMHNNRILQFGGGHSTTATDAIQVFDMKTLKWSSLYKPTPYEFYKEKNLDGSWWKSGPKDAKVGYPRPLGRHTYGFLIVVPEREEMLMLRNGSFVHSFQDQTKKKGRYVSGGGGVFDFKTMAWTRIDLVFGSYGDGALYDPISKKVMGWRGKTMYLFDPTTRKSVRVWNKAARGFFYFPPNRKFYQIRWKQKEVWEVQLDRKDYSKTKLIKTATKIPDTVCPGKMVYDSKNKVMGGCLSYSWSDKKFNNMFTAFDPSKGTWETKKMQGGNPRTAIFYNQTYSPVDNVHIYIGKRGHTWAYRWKK
jgi:hypothetical protein